MTFRKIYNIITGSSTNSEIESSKNEITEQKYSNSEVKTKKEIVSIIFYFIENRLNRYKSNITKIEFSNPSIYCFKSS